MTFDSLCLLVPSFFREMIPLNLGNSNLTRLPDAPRLVIQILLEQVQTRQRAQGSKRFCRLVSDHFAVEVVCVDEDGFKMRDRRWTTDLAEDVGKFMLEECRRVGKS